MSARSSRKTRTEWTGPVAGVLMLGTLLTAGVVAVAQSRTETARTCTVTGTDRVVTPDRSDMRVYTKECGTLAVADVMLRGQFNAADIFGALEEGHTYDLQTIGWRIPALSTFPTIIGTPVEVTR